MSDHHFKQEHGHSHGLVHQSITRSKEGVKVVSYSLFVLLITAVVQVLVFSFTNSVALLADLIHNFGDALTAIPLGVAFLLRNETAERRAGYFVVLAIFVSACVAGIESVQRLLHPQPLAHLGAIAIAGLVGFIGNEIAASIRLRGGRALDSPALIADGNHARIDGIVSLGVTVSSLVVMAGFKQADPLIGLAITILILRITWESFTTIRNDHKGHDHRSE